jgi:hypothetical protein
MESIYSRVDHKLNADDIVEFAAEGTLSKSELADLLAPGVRQDFLDTCAAIERQFRTDCAATGDYCLESGCALEGEACLSALLNAEPAYHRACATAWREMFDNPHNRAAAWQVDATTVLHARV